jgi:hypothetical protein
MTCAELEVLICDYVDGTLPPAEKAEVERHLATCTACAEVARDSRTAVDFMSRAADVEPPPELITKILFDPPWASHRRPLGSGIRSWLRRVLHPLLQPRFAMGMAMTILSFSMLSHFVTPVRQLGPEDLQPARVWAALEDRGYRVWARSVKFYENLKFVYQIQSTLREWQQHQEEEQRVAVENEASAKPDDKKLPVKKPAVNQGGLLQGDTK